MHLLYRLWYIYALLLVAVSTSLLLPVYCLFLSFGEQNYKYARRLRRNQSRMVLFFCGIRPRIINPENLPAGPVIYCPNHSSYIDIIVMLAVMPGDAGFVGKHELTGNPILRLFFGRTDISVRRESAVHGTIAYNKSADFLKNGISIVMFPEGGIKNTVPRIAPFKPGPFRLAVETGFPVIPVLMPDNYRILPDQVMLCRPGISRVIFFPALHPENISSHKELKVQTRDILKTEMDKLLENENRP